MARSILFQEWENEQEHSTYPFSDNATLENDSDVIPKSIFIDARLYVIGAGPRQYLSKIEIGAESAEFTISDDSGVLATGTYEFDAGARTIAFKDAYERPAGILVGSATSLQFFSTWPLGDHVFTVEQTSFEATVLIPTPQVGVRGFVLEGGEFFARDAWVFGEQGVFFTQESPGVIRVDVVGDPAAKRKFCDALGDVETSVFIKTINEMVPNAYGDFKLLSGGAEALDTVLRVEMQKNGLRLRLVGSVLQNAEN